MKLDTGFPADSVEFCPANGFQDILACGTYKLIQASESSNSEDIKKPDVSPPRRIGKCILLRVKENEHEQRLEVLQEVHMPAILDMKWAPSERLLAIADSEGHVSLQELNAAEMQLDEVQNIQCRPLDTLCLSLDWSNRRITKELGKLAVSCSDGSLVILQPDGTGVFTETASWRAHDYEAWITAWDYWNTNVVYSGGDDLKLKVWDMRQGTNSAVLVNKRFDAGITSIQCHPHRENIFAVGSYDATVRVFDTRKPLVPLTQADVGGGAWRVKWHPSSARSSDLLVACMHDGFKVVRFSPSGITPEVDAGSESQHTWEILKHFTAHESLAYGVDWAYGKEESAKGTQSLIASCSFYDHVLCTWEG